MKQLLFFQLILSIFFTPAGLMACQEKKSEKDGITIRGKIVQGTQRESFHVDLAQIKVRILKRVVLPPAPVPENWAQMAPADQESWWKSFLESDAGKKYQTNREQLVESAKEFEAVVESDGSFVVYDVVPGTYGLIARIDKKIGPRTYAFEIFGEIPVSDESDIIELGEKPLVITPILRTGEPAAEWTGATSLTGQEITLESLRGKYVLVNFWASDDPSSEFQKDIQEAVTKLKANHKFELLSVSLDKEKEALTKFVRDNKLQGIHVHATRESRITRVFGVHSTPGMLLIAPDGLIKMTYPEMKKAFESGKPTLNVILDDRISGKDVPISDEADATEAKDASPGKDP